MDVDRLILTIGVRNIMEVDFMTQAGITKEQAQVISKASQDTGFREELRKDARGAIAKELGIKIPEAIEVEVLEETPTKAYLVLPLSRNAMSEDAGGDVQGYWWWNDAEAKQDVEGFWQDWSWSGWQWED